jgi:DMSO/TMAO reductase YedYZ molybdopterin-dependent catalytic subunit
MKRVLSRRQFIGGLTAGSGLLLTGCKDSHFPPNFNGLFGVSDYLTMRVQRLLMSEQTMAREYSASDISTVFPVNGTTMPESERYQQALNNQFQDWRLEVGGLVERPLSLSLAELKSYPSRTQTTLHCCEAGWSAIGEWTGVPLSHVLQQAGLKPGARYVQFECEDDHWYDTIDMFDALHAQTMLAYVMNGGDLPIRHGAPVRLRVERQLGYKNTKYVKRITVVDSLDQIKDGRVSIAIDFDFAWYAGI